jgi:hypothetical protein
MNAAKIELRQFIDLLPSAADGVFQFETPIQKHGRLLGLSEEMINEELKDRRAIARFKQRESKPLVHFPSQESRPAGMAVLMSASLGGNAFESATFGGGVFTHYFCEALGGRAANKDGAVTLRDIYYYVRDRMAEEVAELGQTPSLQSSGFEAENAVLTGSKVEGERRALVIGVDSYMDSGIPSLAFAERDARSVGEILETAGGFKVTYALGGTATRQNILRAIYEMQEADSEVDLVYFSGHSGMEDNQVALFFADTMVRNPNITGLRMDEIAREFKRGTPRSNIMILDTSLPRLALTGFL